MIIRIGKYKTYNEIKDSLLKLDDLYKLNNKINIEIDNNPCRI